MSAALIVFARPPVVGNVKTRLTELITPAEAANLYRAFLYDSLAQYAGIGVAVRLYLTEYAAIRTPDSRLSIHVQKGEDLGARMCSAFEQTHREGYERIVIIGTDHPTLPSQHIVDAFNALVEPPAIVIGPAEDGGYYLMGMSPIFKSLFTGITFSRSNVFEETLIRARRTEAELSTLPAWFDVDRPSDLKRLAAAGKLPPRTASVMRELERMYGL